MSAATAIPVPGLVDADWLGDLFRALAAAGDHVIGPAVQRSAIVLKELTSTAPAANRRGYAFPGVRPCDLHAIAIQDRVLAQPGAVRGAPRPAV